MTACTDRLLDELPHGTCSGRLASTQVRDEQELLVKKRLIQERSLREIFRSERNLVPFALEDALPTKSAGETLRILRFRPRKAGFDGNTGRPRHRP